MFFLLAGIALLLMKYLEIGAIANWDWWAVLSPFGMAMLWWWWADASGYTKRKAMAKMELLKQQRLDKQRATLGMAPTRKRR